MDQSRYWIGIWDGIIGLVGWVSIACIVTLWGFRLSPSSFEAVRVFVPLLFGVFAFQELVRWLWVSKGNWRCLKRRRLAWALIGISGLGFLFFPWTVMPFFLGASGVFGLVVWFRWFVQGLRGVKWLVLLRFHPSRLFVSSFFCLAVLGTFLLKLPRSSVADAPLTWMEALFTSVSAITVTGLSVIDVGTRLTPMGMGILLGLIQLGGLGIMTFAMTFAVFFGGSMGVRDRWLMSEIFSEEGLGTIVRIIWQVTLLTLGIELIGALALYHVSGGTLGELDWDLLGLSFFHAVSAFTHAGFSPVSDSLMGYRDQSSYLMIMMILIVAGSLGFPALLALFRRAFVSFGRVEKPLTVTVKIVLVTTVTLIAGGALLFGILERSGVFADSGGVDWLNALFLSITSRSAGFNTVDTAQLSLGALMVVIALMWVGGAPISTSGGIRTVTLALALINLKSVITGRPVEVFGRSVSEETMRRAFAMVTMSVVLILGVGFALVVLEPGLKVADLIFEAVSAVGTVGLSRGITADLSATSQLIVVGSMFVGRMGFLTFMMSLVRRPSPVRYKLLPEHIQILG